MAEVVQWTAVAADSAAVLALIGDYSRRAEILPRGWRYLRGIGEQGGVGAQMELEMRVGPAPTTHLVQLLSQGDDFIDEGPPGGENYLTTWTVQARGEDTIVQVEMRFAYGGPIGEWFVRRRLRRALREMLEKLKAAVEAR